LWRNGWMDHDSTWYGGSLGPGQIGLDGDPAPHGKGYSSPHFSASVYSGQTAGWILFCSVPQPSSIRGLATPWTYFLHLSLSSVILIDSCTESLVHDLMLSIQAVRGLPCLRAHGIVPCIISFCRQFPCFLMDGLGYHKYHLVRR